MENQPPNLENKNTPVGFINVLKYAPHCCQAERACVFPLNIVEKKNVYRAAGNKCSRFSW